MLQMGYLESHQIIESSCLHHFFDLSGKLKDFGITLVHANVIEKIVEYVANHLHLLLCLKIVIYHASSLVSHDLVPSFGLQSLQVCQNSGYSTTQVVKFLVHHLLLSGVEAWLILLIPLVLFQLRSVWVIVRKTCIVWPRLSMVLVMLLIVVLAILLVIFSKVLVIVLTLNWIAERIVLPILVTFLAITIKITLILTIRARKV